MATRHKEALCSAQDLPDPAALETEHTHLVGSAARPPVIPTGLPRPVAPIIPLRNPMRLKRTLDDEMTPPFRRHDCRSYRECLDRACAARWESWCCTGCYAFEPADRPETSTNRGRDFY